MSLQWTRYPLECGSACEGPGLSTDIPASAARWQLALHKETRMTHQGLVHGTDDLGSQPGQEVTLKFSFSRI